MAFTETFTGTINTELQTLSGWTRQVDGATRALLDGSGNISGSASGGGGSGPSLFTCTDQGAANQYVTGTIRADWTTQTGDGYIVVRAVDTSNFIGMYCGGTGATGFRLIKVVAGVETQLDATQCAAGTVFKIECNGSDIEWFADDVSLGTFIVSDVSTSETSAGYIVDTVGSTGYFSAFENGSLAAATQISTQPLYYGATLLANKTGIQWTLRSGHANLTGDVLGSGTAGTTNGSGVFTPDGSWSFGAVDDPVTLSLYWEEGSSPVVDRSLIVKTTLVAAA